jgi:hypothetical protein
LREQRNIIGRYRNLARVAMICAVRASDFDALVFFFPQTFHK